jgi:hypothetical protein
MVEKNDKSQFIFFADRWEHLEMKIIFLALCLGK